MSVSGIPRPSAVSHYRIHGLTVRSELDLPEPTCPPSDPDLVLVWDRDSEALAPQAEDGEILAELMVDGQLLYRAATLKEGGMVIDFRETCRFSVDPALRLIRAKPGPQVAEALISILAAGYLMAFVLALRGVCILHASAVAFEGMGLGIIGSAGMGKSSFAALLCAAGADLITDDVLRVEVDADPPRSVRGTSHLRLRPPAWPILDLFEEKPQTEETVDGRLAVYPTRAAETAPLNAVLIPRRGIDDDLTAERLSEAEALWMLVQYPRIYGWRSETVLSRSFLQLADLVRKVPVLSLSMPWGPPFEKRMAPAALQRIVDVLGR